jgi:16S rRNA processing protein RimM
LNNEIPSKEPDQERGSDSSTTEPRFLVIGRVVKPHGVRGEVRVQVITDVPERFEWLKTVYVGERDPQPMVVESVRFHKTFVLVKLAGYDTREAAVSLRSQILQVPESEAVPLEEDEYVL